MKKDMIIKVKRGKTISLLVLLFVLCMKANAQFDPMFSQYMNNEMFINPAYTGTRQVTTATLLYRNQWTGFDGAPITQTFSLHSPVGKKYGLGLSAMNESIGISSMFKVNANYAYRIRTGPKSNLSFGLLGGIIHVHQNLDELVLINPNDHLFTNNKPSANAPTAGFGMFFYTKKFYAGFSIPKMIKNSIEPTGVKNSTSPRDWHYYLTSAIVLDLSENFKLKPSFMIKEVSGAPIQGEFALHGLISNVLWLGASYRTGDAVSFLTGFQFTQQLRVYYSYDYALTELQNHSSGSHEIVIGYDFGTVRNRISSPRYF